jgi:rRNA maturation endonuclease Nob1
MKIKCYGCKNISLLEENNGICPYCEGKGYLEEKSKRLMMREDGF